MGVRYCSKCGGIRSARSSSLCSYCREDLRRARSKEWVKNRKKAFGEVMKNHPEGITRSNLEQIKKEVKKAES